MAQKHASLTSSSYDLFILSGESSGDALAEKLLQSLLKSHPNLKIAGVAGPKMRQYPIDVIESIENLSVMGFKDVLFHLPKIYLIFQTIKRWLLTHAPKVIILVDYAEFNLLLSKALKKAAISSKIIQYVCPSVWAWRTSRKQVMIKSLDYLICLFPFEVAHFSSTTLKAGFFGHPLAITMKDEKSLQSPGALKKPILTLFPGSRRHEIKNNLPLQLKVALDVAGHTHKIAISYANEHLLCEINKILSQFDSKNLCLFPSSENSFWMKQSTASIATSGTINLELAFNKVPTIVTYFISKLDFFIARKIFKIFLNFYSIVNINAKKEVFPELFGPSFNESNLKDLLKDLLENADKRIIISNECQKIYNTLFCPLGTEECAQMINSMIENS